ncbi:uncharacterized protein [Dermacentor andersoni]|uniref:uncharacterized protein n=1 Tax=Dermacentor andersoni TaxID=34620 RepID=UPI00241808A6|nr:uncharacterized protein LOC129386470 [Dermacentor andersoni]
MFEESRHLNLAFRRRAKMADFFRGAAKMADVVREAMKMADVVREAMKMADVVREAMKMADFFREAAETTDFFREAAETTDFFREAAETTDFFREAAETTDFFREAAKRADISHMAPPGTVVHAIGVAARSILQRTGIVQQGTGGATPATRWAILHQYAEKPVLSSTSLPQRRGLCQLPQDSRPRLS